MRYMFRLLIAGFLVAGLAGFGNQAQGQLGGLKKKVKNKVEKKAEDKADEKIDETVDKAAGDGQKSGEGEKAESEDQEGSSAAAGPKGGTATAEDMTLYTKFDFVPGDKVIFYDDLSREEIGEFPSRWDLKSGVFEIVKKSGQNWIMCSDQGYILPRIEPGILPPKYTIEMEFFNKGLGAKGHWFSIEWLNNNGQEIGILKVQDHKHTSLFINGEQLASKDLATDLSPGKHVMRVMATKSTLKCYIDNERVANVPAVAGFAPVALRVHTDPWTDEADNPMLIGAFRYAEGGKTLREQLDEAGKIITHGILFDSGSDKIKAESFKTLADIGQLLTDDAALRLSIEGHTDSDGADESNMTLSQNRAKSVKTYLMEVNKIDASRLETNGHGETKPIDTNNTPEGKANNRRVELVKL